MNDETYSVELTFRQWMDVCHALGHINTHYRMREMLGQANRYSAINDEIADQLKHYGENDD